MTMRTQGLGKGPQCGHTHLTKTIPWIQDASRSRLDGVGVSAVKAIPIPEVFLVSARPWAGSEGARG